MAKVPLRAYNSEIEKLIENGHTQEAIAHCKHILRSFPKHIDTYRLLGKAFLESERYTEAADILQRVLSVIPDDFIAQIGMSLIREYGSDLDGAIYHMERAFEVQPSNTAIQNELRRLYGRRDGVQPPKIRLTRGALVRMYARGELYPQAIAEIRAALAEDPKRVDLQVILARLFYLSGQKVQAAETCSQLVNQLPYCYEANRILAEVLPGTTRSEDARLYRERLQALDPYIAYLSENTPTSASVSDNAVQVEKLDYQPGQEEPTQPEWTRTVGVAWEETKESEGNPAWMADEEDQTAQEQPPASESAAEPADIPDWMASAGWSKSAGEEQEAPTVFEETDTSEMISAAPAEIPDWVKDLAPTTELQSAAERDETTEEDSDWANIILNEPVDTVSTPPFDAQPGDIENPAEEVLSEPPALDLTAPGTGADLPDWLNAMTEPGQIGSQEDMPGWLQPEASATSETSVPAELEPPDWMNDLNLETEINGSADLGEAGTVNASIPAESTLLPTQELDHEPINGTIQQPQETIEPVLSDNPAYTPDLPVIQDDVDAEKQPIISPEGDMDAALAWLEALAAKQGAEEGTLTSQPEERSEEMPAWLSDEMNATTSIEGREAPVAEEPAEIQAGLIEEAPFPELEVQGENQDEQPAPETAQVPPWQLENVGESAEKEQVAFILDESSQDAFTGEQGTQERMEQPESEDTPAVETGMLPPWIEDLATVQQPDNQMVNETQTASQDLQGTGVASGEDIDAALAWLESLAARQGADEATLLVNPEDRLEKAPEWLSVEDSLKPTAVTGERLSDEVQAEPPGPFGQDQILLEGTPKPSEPEEITGEVIPSETLLEAIPISETPAGAETTVPSLEQAQEIEPALNGIGWVEEEKLSSEKTQPVTIRPAEDKSSTGVIEVEPPHEESELTEPEPVAFKEAPEQWIPEVENDQANQAEVEPAELEPLPEWLQDLTSYGASSGISNTDEAIPKWLQDLDKPVTTQEEEESLPASLPPETEWINEDQASEEDLSVPISTVSETDEYTFSEPEAAIILEEVSAPIEQPVVEMPNPPLEAADGSLLTSGQKALAKGNIDSALGYYDQLTQAGESLDETIHDLREALDRYPVNTSIWQSLGDAYLRSNRVQDALNAYTKAEELLR